MMANVHHHKRFTGLFAALAVLTIAALPAHAASKGNAFEQLQGSWKCGGGGCWIQPIGGDRERVSCRVNYSGGGTSLSQNIDCRGSIQLNVRAKMQMTSGSRVAGDWSSYNSQTGRTAGGASGIVRGSRISIGISGSNGFLGAMRATLSGNSHTVSIYQTKNGKRHLVSRLSLRRH